MSTWRSRLSHPADRELTRLAVPTLGALVAAPLFYLGDSAVVARVSPEALAGLGIASTVLTTAVALCIFLAYGTTASVARLIGAGRSFDAIRQGVDGMWLGLLLGVVLAIAGVALADPIVGWFHVEPAVDQAATTYLRIGSLGMPAMLLSLAATGVLRGLRNTRTPLVVTSVAAIANLLLNILLVLGLSWGIAGSAWGTVIVEWVAAFVYVVVIARGARRLQVPFVPDRAGLLESAHAGVPLVLRVLAMRVVLVIAVVVASGLGTIDLAAYQLAYALYGFLALALDAIAIAGQTIVGRYLGANDVPGVHSSTRRMFEWGIAAGFGLGFLVVALRPLYVPWLTPDAAVQDALLPALVMVGILQIPAGIAFTIDGVLIGAGDLRWLAWQAIATTGIFLVAIAVVVAAGGGLVALWGALIVWMCARAILLSLRVRTDTWIVTGATRKV